MRPPLPGWLVSLSSLFLLLRLCSAFRCLSSSGKVLYKPTALRSALQTLHSYEGDEKLAKLAKLITTSENVHTNFAVSEALFTIGTHISRSTYTNDDTLALVNTAALLPQLNTLVLKLIKRLDVHDRSDARVIIKPVQLCKSLVGVVRLTSFDRGRHFDAIYSPEARSHTLQLLHSSSTARVVHGMNGQGVSNLVWALGALGFDGRSLPPILMDDVFERAQDISAEMTDQTISNILIGLQRMGYSWADIPTPLQSCLSSSICRQCLKLSPQALGNILYSLGKMGASYLVLTDRVHMALELGVRKSAGSMMRRDIMQVVQGLALMGYSWTSLTAATQEAISVAVYSQASKQWAVRSGSGTPPTGEGFAVEIGTTMYGLAQLGVRWAEAPSALRAAVLMAFTALAAGRGQEHRQVASRALAVSLYSLSKLGAAYPTLPTEVRRAIARCLLDYTLNPQEAVMTTKALGRMGTSWFTDMPTVVQSSVYRQLAVVLDSYEEGSSSSERLRYEGFSTIICNLGAMGVTLQELPAELRTKVDERCLLCLQGADAERLSSLLHVLVSVKSQWDDFNGEAKKATLQALLNALGGGENESATMSSALYSLVEMKADLADTAAAETAAAIYTYVLRELPAMSLTHTLNWMRGTNLAVGPSVQRRWGEMHSLLLQAVLRHGEELATDPVACAVAMSTLSAVEHIKSDTARRPLVIALFEALLVRAAPGMGVKQLTMAIYALCGLGHSSALMGTQSLQSVLQSSCRLLSSSAAVKEEEVVSLLRALAALGVQWQQLQEGDRAVQLSALPTELSTAASLELYSSLVKMRCFDASTDGAAEQVAEKRFITKLYRAEGAASEGEGSVAAGLLDGDSSRRLLRTLETLSRSGMDVSTMRPEARQLFLLRTCEGLVESPPSSADYMQRLLRALSSMGVRWTQLPPTGQYIVLGYSAKCIDLAAPSTEAAPHRLAHVPFPLLAELVVFGSTWIDMRHTAPSIAERLLHSACVDFISLRRLDVDRMVEDSQRFASTVGGLRIEYHLLDAASKRLLVYSLTRVCRSYLSAQRTGAARSEMLSALQLLPLLGASWAALPSRPRNELSLALGDILVCGDDTAAEHVLSSLAATGGKLRMLTKNLREALAERRAVFSGGAADSNPEDNK